MPERAFKPWVAQGRLTLRLDATSRPEATNIARRTDLRDWEFEFLGVELDKKPKVAR